MNKLRKRSIIALFNLLIIFIFSGVSQATIYFQFDAESEEVGSTLPLLRGNPANFCQTECGGSGDKGTIQEIGGGPQGDKYFVWKTVDLQHDNRTEIKSDSLPDSEGWSITLEIDKPYYLAYYMRFDRIDGKDIWKVGNIQYADKGVELYSSSVRLLTSRGQWTHMAANQPHHYTVWGGIMSGDNPDVVWGQNRNGYSPSNPIQLEYERWYAVVMEFKLSCNKTGSLAVYIDGVKTEEYLNVNTINSTCSPEIGKIQVGGTMGQPSYDTPAHYRKFDALILTDNLQDIVNGGYLSESPDPPQDPPGSPPDFSAN